MATARSVAPPAVAEGRFGARVARGPRCTALWSDGGTRLVLELAYRASGGGGVVVEAETT